MQHLCVVRALALAACLVAVALADSHRAPALAQTVDSHQHRFGNAEKWANIFDDPARDAWQKPAEVIRALALAPDAAVADIGSGTGYFAVRLARELPRGQVYGIDTEPDMVHYLAERSRKEGLANITPVHGSAGDPRLPAPVDLAMLVDVYHHVPDRERYFRALAKSLKPGGRLAIIDFTLESPHGPPRHGRVPAADVKRELAAAGYRLAQEHAFLPYQYFLVFSPAAR